MMLMMIDDAADDVLEGAGLRDQARPRQCACRVCALRALVIIVKECIPYMFFIQYYDTLNFLRKTVGMNLNYIT